MVDYVLKSVVFQGNTGVSPKLDQLTPLSPILTFHMTDLGVMKCFIFHDDS